MCVCVCVLLINKHSVRVCVGAAKFTARPFENFLKTKKKKKNSHKSRARYFHFSAARWRRRRRFINLLAGRQRQGSGGGRVLTYLRARPAARRRE